MISLRESLADAMQVMLDTVSGTEPRGITTGFPHFDQLVRGLHPGSLTVLASRPSLGKTAFALNIVRNLMGRKPEIPILYCSSLSSTELTFQLLTILSGVRCSYDHDLRGDESARLTAAISTVQDYPLCFGDSRTQDEVFFRRTADSQAEKHFELIIMDPVPAERLSRLKTLAEKLEVPAVALVSVGEKNGGIPGSDMVDTVIYLNRSRRESETGTGAPVSLTVTRNRFGLCGTCRMNFIPQTMQFWSFDNEDAEE